jgi:predicted Fe-Mo cluster-binding NifX family protein
MKIAISSLKNSITSPFDFRFEKPSYFLIIDEDTLNYDSFSNMDSNSAEDICRKNVSFFRDLGVETLIAGELNNNFLRILHDAGIRVYEGKEGSIKENIDAFKRHCLAQNISYNYIHNKVKGLIKKPCTQDDNFEIIAGAVPKDRKKRLKIPGAQVLYKEKTPVKFFKKFSGPVNLKDISWGGTSFEVRQCLKPGTPMDLKIIIPGTEKLMIKGRIAWKNYDPYNNRSFAGIQFLPFGEEKNYNSLQCYKRLDQITKQYLYSNYLQ